MGDDDQEAATEVEEMFDLSSWVLREKPVPEQAPVEETEWGNFQAASTSQPARREEEPLEERCHFDDAAIQDNLLQLHGQIEARIVTPEPVRTDATHFRKPGLLLMSELPESHDLKVDYAFWLADRARTERDISYALSELDSTSYLLTRAGPVTERHEDRVALGTIIAQAKGQVVAKQPVWLKRLTSLFYLGPGLHALRLWQ